MHSVELDTQAALKAAATDNDGDDDDVEKTPHIQRSV